MASTFDAYQAILNSGLFDPEHYGRQVGIADWRGADPLVHFLEHGVAQRASPHPSFDPDFYISQCRTSGAAIPANPLLHFIEIGAAQGLSTHPENPLQGGSAASEDGIVFFIERPNISGGETLAVENSLEIGGWAFSSAGRVRLVLSAGKKVLARTSAEIARHDVLEAFPAAPQALRSGFNISVPRQSISADLCAVTLRMIDAAGREKRIDFAVEMRRVPASEAGLSELEASVRERFNAILHDLGEEAAALARKARDREAAARNRHRMAILSKIATDAAFSRPAGSSPIARLGHAAYLLTARPEARQPRALFLDATTPTPDRDAGSNNILQHMRIFGSLGIAVTFAPIDDFARASPYTERLQQQGIEVLCRPETSDLRSYLNAHGAGLAVVYIHRFTVAEQAIPLVRKLAPQARIVFNNADLHHLRMQRQRAVDPTAWNAQLIADFRARELAAIRASDCTILLSTAERVLLARELPQARLFHVPWVLQEGRVPPVRRAGRSDIMFVGNFGHSPNGDAMRYFVSEVMPLIRRRRPGTRLHIYGNRAGDLSELARDDVIVEGHIAQLSEAFSRHLVSVAPLRFGAGFKGKLAESLRCGVPMVASSIAAEGTHLSHGKELLIADTPADVAEATLRLLENRQLWNAMSRAGQNAARKRFNFRHIRKIFSEVLEELGVRTSTPGRKPPRKGKRARPVSVPRNRR